MIVEIRGGNNVKRFHTSHRTQEETVGHHSANLCGILLRLDPNCSRSVLVAALMHDVAEVYTGDVPAPFKWHHPDVKSALNEAELAYWDRYKLPGVDDVLTEEEMKLLKLADMLDLVLSSLEEMGRGNSYAKQMVENGQAYIDKMGLSTQLFNMCETMVMEVKLEWQQTTSK